MCTILYTDIQWSGYTRLLYVHFLIKVLHHLHIKHFQKSKEPPVSMSLLKFSVSSCIAKKGEEVLKVKQFCPISILFLLKQIDYEYLMRLGVCEPLCVCVCFKRETLLTYPFLLHRPQTRHSTSLSPCLDQWFWERGWIMKRSHATWSSFRPT